MADNLDFWELLPQVALLAGREEVVDAFRERFREDIIGLLTMLHRLGLVWGATELHPCPPTECDLCNLELDQRPWFVDGRTADGAVANMCPLCFYKEGHSIGWGRGQLYLRLPGKEWRLVSGGDPAS